MTKMVNLKVQNHSKFKKWQICFFLVPQIDHPVPLCMQQDAGHFTYNAFRKQYNPAALTLKIPY